MLHAIINLQKGHTQIVKLLLNTPGVDVNKKNTKGKTPLYNAAKVSKYHNKHK